MRRRCRDDDVPAVDGFNTKRPNTILTIYSAATSLSGATGLSLKRPAKLQFKCIGANNSTGRPYDQADYDNGWGHGGGAVMELSILLAAAPFHPASYCLPAFRQKVNMEKLWF